jgi:hypothetical protein
VKDLVKNQYSFQRITKDLLWVAKDAAALLQILPRQIRWMFRKFNSNDFAFEIKVPELVELRRQLDVNGRRTSLSVLISGLLIASSIALQHSSGRMIGAYPILAVVYILVAAVFLLALFLKSFK